MKRKVRTRKLGIKFKILIPVCVCVLVVCVVMGINSYKHIKDGMVEMGVQKKDLPKLIDKLEKDMKKAAKILDFERAAEIRDKLKKLREMAES